MSLKQAELALSTKMLTNEQKQQILAETGLIATENTIQAELLQTTLAQAGLNAEKQNSILKDLGLMNIKTNELLTHKACTKAALEEQLALHGVTGAQAENIISTLGLSSANGVATISFELLGASIKKATAELWAFLTTTPVGWLILAGTAIAGTVALVDALTVSLDEAKENLSNLKDECKNIESELSSMNEELKTTVDRMTELENKDKLSFTEKEEYDNLVKNNNELQRSIDLLELEQKIRNQDKNKAFVQTMDTFNSQIQNGYMGASITQGQHIDIQYSQREKYLKRIEELTADYNKAQTEEEKRKIQSEIDNIKLQIDSINSYFAEKSKELTEISSDISYIRNPSTEDDRAVNEWLDYINDFQDKVAISIGGNNAKTNTFNRIVDNWKFDEVIQGLQNLGKQGQVTADMLNDPKYDEFIQKLVELGVIDSADNLDLIALAFNNFGVAVLDTGEKVENTTNDIYKLKQATEELKTALDEAFSNQSTLQSAFDKIKEGSSLSADEVRKIIELCPELASEFTKTADGYTIDSQKLIDANEAIVESTKKSIQERADYLKSFINTDYNINNIGNYYEAKQYDEWKKSVESAKYELNGLELLLSMFGLTTEDTVDKVKELSDKYDELSDSTSKLVGKAKTLSSAFAEQNENGSLSTETVLSLIENGYAAALMYDKTTGAIRLNADAYIALATAEIEAQIADLETQKAIADTSAIEAKKSIVSNLGWSYLGAAQSALELARAESIINNAEADVSNYDAKIKALEEYKNHLNDITNGTYGGSGSSSNTDPNKEAFDTANNIRKHWLAMGKDNTGKKYTEEMYYAWLDSADGYKKYFSDLTKYTDEYRQYEEEIYKWRINKDKELFEERIENYEKLKDKELNDSEYDNPIKKYEEAGKIINQEMSAIQSRIQELVESGSSAVQDEIDSLKEKYDSLKEEQEEIQKDIWDTRVENEKTFWEQQKEAVETYYDNEIKNLEKIEDEQERINKKEELRLNLIKAQQELLDAKKNRNQLLFANGGFYYDYDQEAVQKAQENIANAEQDITDFNNDETKRLLEEQRDNEIAYYNTIIEMLEAYINKTLPIETSDSEVFNTAMSSKYAQSVLNKQTEITPVTLESFLQDRFPNYNKQALASGYDLLGKIMNKPVSSTLNAWDNLKKMNAQNYTVNNNNNNSVYIENMPITVPVGTTEEQVQAMIDQFASGVISTVRAKRAKLQ